MPSACRREIEGRTADRSRSGAGAAGAPSINGRPRAPFGRDEVYRLITRMDDIVDAVEDASERFVLYDIEGYQHREIGQIMGIAEGTSKTQLFRARRLLRRLLG